MLPGSWLKSLVLLAVVLSCCGRCSSQEKTEKRKPIFSAAEAAKILKEDPKPADKAKQEDSALSARPATKGLSALDLAKLPPDVKDAFFAAAKAEFEHDAWALRQRRKIFEWQFWAGIFVFLVSIGVVIMGLYMSWLQFYAYFRLLQLPPAVQATVQSAATTSVSAPAGTAAAGASMSAAPAGITAAGAPMSAAPEGTAAKDLASPAPKTGDEHGGDELTKLYQGQSIEIPGVVKVTTPIVGVVILALSLAFFYLYLQFVFPIQSTQSSQPAKSAVKE
jgi:hypothetical protein